MRKLIPLSDRIVVRPKAIEETSAGGIFLPDGTKEKPLFGTVLAMGPGRTLQSGVTLPMPEVEPGDTIMFAHYGGHEIRFNNETLYLLQASDVMAQRTE